MDLRGFVLASLIVYLMGMRLRIFQLYGCYYLADRV